MAYTANIPQAADDPSASQPQLLANFQQISTLVNVNHGDFDSSTEGKHKFVQMPEQGAAPATAADEGALYTKEVSGATQLFWREESSGTEYQITAQETFAGGQGSITLPGGFTIKYGSGSGITGTVSFTAPFATAAFAVTCTPIQSGDPDDTFFVNTLNANGFNFRWSGTGATGFYWIAMGH